MTMIIGDPAVRGSAPWRRRLLALGAVVAAGQALLSGTVAQPAPPLAESARGGDSTDANPSAAIEPPVRRLYVPLSELGALLQKDDRSVLLRRDEFRRLWNAAQRESATALRTPVDVVISTSDYAGRLEGDLLVLSAQIQFTQLTAGWQVLPIPVGGLSLGAASLDGEAAAISRDPKQPDTLLVFSRTPGVHRLNLELFADAAAAGSDRLSEFALSGAPSGALSLELPERKSLLVDGFTVKRADGPAEGADYRIPIGGRARISLRVTDGESAETADALLFARTAYGLRAAPGEVTWSTQTTLNVYGRALDQLKFTIPRNVDVAAVESVGLAAWDMNDAEDVGRTEITLDYRTPIAGTSHVTIRGVFVPDEDQWDVPTLLLQGADSHVAGILVEHDAGIRLQPEYDDSVRPIEVQDLPAIELDVVTGARRRTPEERDARGRLGIVVREAEPAAPETVHRLPNAGRQDRMAFQSLRADFELSFHTPRRSGTMQAAMTNLLHISDAGLDLATMLDVQTSVAPLFEVRVTLPAEFDLTEVTLAGQSAQWTLGAEEVGQIDVLIPLVAPLHPGETARINLSAHADPEDWPVESDPVLFALPQVGLPQAEMIEARYGISAGDDLDVETVDLTGLDSARGEDATGLRRLMEPLGRTLKMGFTDQDSGFTGELSISRRPVTFSVSTLWLSRLEPQRTVSFLRSTVTVEAGGLEGLLIELPERIAADARFRLSPITPPAPRVELPGGRRPPVPTIVEQSIAEAAGGRRTWALRFDRRLHGTHELTAVLTEARDDGDWVSLFTPTFLGADRQHGWIAVEAREDQRLAVTAADVVGRPLRPVDPIDLPGMASEDPGKRRIIAGFRFSRPGATATVNEQPLEQASVPAAIVDRVDLRSLLAPSGTLQHRMDVEFRAVGVQSLLLTLPDECELWAVEVDAMPIEVRRSPSGYQVPLPSMDAPEAVRSLQVFYSSQLGALATAGRFQQMEPQLAARLGNGEIQPLDVLARDWTLLYPRDVVLLDSRGRFVPSGTLQDDTLFSRVKELIDPPSAASLGWRLAAAAAALAVLWITVLSFRRSPSTLVLISGAVLGGVVLIALLLPAVQQSREAAQRTQNLNKLRQLGMAVGDAPPAGSIERGGGLGGGGMGGGEDFVPLAPFGRVDPIVPADTSLDLESLVPNNRSVPELAQQMPAPQPQSSSGPAIAPADAAGKRLDFDGVSEMSIQNGFLAGVAVPPGAEGVGRRGALLSLSLALDAPQGMREMPFRSVGTMGDGESPAMDVQYASRPYREVMALVAACGVVLAMWWLRRANASLRGVLAVLTVIVPLALVTVIPSLRSMIVEGVLLGGIAGAILWGVRALAGMFPGSRSRVGTPNVRAGQVVTGLVLTGSLWSGSTISSAEETAAFQGEQSQSSAAETDANDDVPTVIVPYADGDPLAADRVLLTRELFDRLRSQAHPAEAPEDPAPVDGVVAEAEYAVLVGGRKTEGGGTPGLNVSARYVLHSFHQQPVVLPLPLSNVAVEEARLDGTAAIVQSAGDEGLGAVVPTDGRHVLELTFNLPAEVHAASGEFTLPLRPVASGKLRMTLPPRDDWSISVLRDGRTPIGYRRQAVGDDGVTVVIPIDQGGRISVSWQPDQSTGARQGIVNVESTTAVQVDDAGVLLRAAYDVTVKQGAISRVAFDVPDSLRLKRLWGPDVAGWELDDEPGRRTLTVFLRRAIDDQTRILADLFAAETAAADQPSFDVASPAPREVTRESGQIVLLSDDVRELRTGATEGLVRTNSLNGKLPEELNPQSLPPRGTFRFTSRPWRLPLIVSIRRPQVRVTAAHGMYVGNRKLRLSSRLQFELSGAPRRLLRVLLPQEFLLADVHSDDVEEWFVEGGELVLDLGRPRGGQVTVTFEGYSPRREGDPEVVLETPLPQDIQRQETRMAVWIEEGLSLAIDSFEGWRPFAADELPAELRALHDRAAQFAFRSTELEPELILVQVERAKPEIAGVAVTLIAVSDPSVDYGMTLRWTIERAAVDLLTFTTPDWLAGRLELTGEGIRHTSSETLADGRVRWKVSLEGAVRGQYLLSAIATLPPPADGRVSAPEIRFEHAAEDRGRGEISNVFRQQSYAVLVNLSASQITRADGAAHDAVTAENLPLTLRSELLAQAMDVVRIPSNVSVDWQMQTVTEQQTAAATVTSADLMTVLAADGSWRTQADYRVRNRGHQFLAVLVPNGARLLSVRVKDRPARSLRTELNQRPVALVPLPQTSAADLSFVVRLVFQGSLPRPLSRSLAVQGEQIALPVPAVISPRQSAEYGVPVVSTNWTVTVPDDFDASPVADGRLTNVSYHPDGLTGVMSYLQELQELADLNMQVVDTSLSMSQRNRAALNLRGLGAKLQNPTNDGIERYGKRPSGIPEELEKLAEQREQLLSESLQNADELEGVVSEWNTNGASLFDGNRNGRQYILGNTIQIQQDNREFDSNVMDLDADAGFRFDRSSKDDNSRHAEEGEGRVSNVERSRSMLKEQLANQKALNTPASDAPASGEDSAVPSLITGAGRAPILDGSRWNIVGREQGGDVTIAGTSDALGIGGFDAGSAQAGDAGGSKSGALSLPIEIPLDGYPLSFSKLGGDPMLTLALRPRESVAWGLRWLWTAAWIGVGLVALRLLTGAAGRVDTKRVMAMGGFLSGLLVLLMLPAPTAWLGLPLIVLSAIVWSASTSARRDSIVVHPPA